jgi:signal transduction histidine kinase
VRERLTGAFVAVTVTLLLAVLLARSYATDGRLRAESTEALEERAAIMAALVDLRLADGRAVDEDSLADLVEPDQRLEYEQVGQPEVVIEGGDFAEGNDGQNFVAVLDLPAADATLTLRQSDEVLDDLVGDERGSIALVLLLAAIVAALVGFLVSRLLAAPFLKLAVAASQLGRGRFDLDLPRTRIPEARAISSALKTSAGQLQERLAGEEAFAQHASHVLRTPMTGLRLDLEDLSTREDLPPDVRATAAHAVTRIDAMDQIAGELVALSRSNSIVAGAEIPLRDLATDSAQSWADALGPYDRTLTARIDGDLDATYTPGPIEFVLDTLLADVIRRGQGAVRMTFHADADGHLRVSVTSAGEARTEPGSRGATPATASRSCCRSGEVRRRPASGSRRGCGCRGTGAA